VESMFLLIMPIEYSARRTRMSTKKKKSGMLSLLGGNTIDFPGHHEAPKKKAKAKKASKKKSKK